MGYTEAEHYIRTEKQNTRSLDEQVTISHAMWDEGIGPGHGGLKEDEVEDELNLNLDFRVGTSLDHLTEIEALEVVEPSGPDFYAISESRDEIVNGKVEEVAEDDSESIISHMHDDDPVDEGESATAADGAGVTVRTVLAERFDLTPEAVEQYLRTGDQMDKLNEAVEAIEESNEVEKRESYGKIVFRRGAYRYRLTKKHNNRYEQ